MLHCRGVLRRFNILWVSGSNETPGSAEKDPSNNFTDAVPSRFIPNCSRRYPEPNGVFWAWLYCFVLTAQIYLAISSGFVIDTQGPFHCLGSTWEISLLSIIGAGTSTLTRPPRLTLSSLSCLPIIRYRYRLCSKRTSRFTSFAVRRVSLSSYLGSVLKYGARFNTRASARPVK